MKNNALLILLLSIFMNCSSQRLTKTPVEQKTSFSQIENLEGNWYNTKITINKNGVKTNLKMECPGKSFWEIKKMSGRYQLLKHLATGKTCETHISKTNGLSLQNGHLEYTEDDISKSDSIEKLSDRKFKISEISFANGERMLIENFYEKN